MAKLKHITKYHERALELKYKGYSYQNIAEDINHRFQKSRRPNSPSKRLRIGSSNQEHYRKPTGSMRRNWISSTKKL